MYDDDDDDDDRTTTMTIIITRKAHAIASLVQAAHPKFHV